MSSLPSLHPNTKRSIARTRLTDIYGQALAIDDDTLDLVIIEQEHHATHSGDHYFIKRVRDVTGAGTISYSAFVSPDIDLEFHVRAKITAESEFWAGIYEGGSVSDLGTPMPSLNNKRNSSKVSKLLGYSNPTVITDGLLIWQGQTGTGGKPTGVAPEFGYEIVIKRNTIYLFKSVKEAAGTHYTTLDFWWYEQEHKSQFED